MPSIVSNLLQPPQHHLDFESVGVLPESHSWPPLDEEHPTVAEQVPVIDLAGADAATHIARACEEWGLFQVTNHGVPACLLGRLEAQARRLFSLPTQQKLRAARSPGDISGYGLAPISSFFSKLMWSEGFTLAGSPINHARKLWPHDNTQSFCDVVEEYDEEMKELAGRLMRLILVSLGVGEEEEMSKRSTRDLAGVLQMNSYPACPNPDRAMGLAAHTDSSLLTVLYQSSTSGLQVLRDGPAPRRYWVTVPPVPGALVVNVGDLLHILSNGRFRSVLHRAIVNRTHHRLSAAYICGPRACVEVSPIDSLVSSGKGPAYRAVTWPDYLGLKAKLFNNALASLVREEPHSDTTLLTARV